MTSKRWVWVRTPKKVCDHFSPGEKQQQGSSREHTLLHPHRPRHVHVQRVILFEHTHTQLPRLATNDGCGSIKVWVLVEQLGGDLGFAVDSVLRGDQVKGAGRLDNAELFLVLNLGVPPCALHPPDLRRGRVVDAAHEGVEELTESEEQQQAHSHFAAPHSRHDKAVVSGRLSSSRAVQ